jgi:hypothetical protein
MSEANYGRAANLASQGDRHKTLIFLFTALSHELTTWTPQFWDKIATYMKKFDVYLSGILAGVSELKSRVQKSIVITCGSHVAYMEM